jgi:hypothetical protein
MMQLIQDKTTTVIAAGAVASPWWLPSLQSISETAALLVPIAGLCWLCLQIVLKIKNNNK